jgi:hypothetical protein
VRIADTSVKIRSAHLPKVNQGNYRCVNQLGDAVWSRRLVPTFRRNILSPSSGCKRKPSMKKCDGERIGASHNENKYCGPENGPLHVHRSYWSRPGSPLSRVWVTSFVANCLHKPAGRSPDTLLKLEVACSSETSVSAYKSTRYHNPKYSKKFWEELIAYFP